MTKIIIISQNDVYIDSLIYKKHWRRFIIGMLDVTCINIHSFPSISITEEIKDANIKSISFDNIENFVRSASFKMVIDDQASANKEDISYEVQLQWFTCLAMKALEEMKFVKSGEWTEGRYNSGFRYHNALTSYSLTPEGIDCALKLQEHNDNDKRHHATVSYSKKAFWVSVSALFIAVISMSFNYKRLDLYEEQVNKIEANQTALIKKLRESTPIEKAILWRQLQNEK